MILSFKKKFRWIDPNGKFLNTNFEQKILERTKIHTIREDPTDRWKAGNKINFVTGARSKNYNEFYLGECYSVQYISIRHSLMNGKKHIVVTVGDTPQDPKVLYNGARNNPTQHENVLQLAKNDGFDSIENFFKFFRKDIFVHKLIHWTDFKYDV